MRAPGRGWRGGGLAPGPIPGRGRTPTVAGRRGGRGSNMRPVHGRLLLAAAVVGAITAGTTPSASAVDVQRATDEQLRGVFARSHTGPLSAADRALLLSRPDVAG